MSTEQRIEQFRNMTEADPDNELGHFSLAKAYIDAERFADALTPLQRVLELNPQQSKAYHLLATAQLRVNQRDHALETLRRGHPVAAARGDVMPRDAMARMLADLGAPVPEAGPSTTAPNVGAGLETDQQGFRCARCGRAGERLPKPPFRGDLGVTVHARVCAACWREWIMMGTKVINELGLQLASPDAQATYDMHMKEFLQLDG